jgi:tetratricopeptide (TPR) repeat protein
VDEVEQSLDVLASTRRDLPERHHSLRAVFERSWQLLTPHEQLVFPRLSVFQGGFTLEAACQVAGADLPVLGRLVAKSLLRTMTTESGATIRYDIHDILRQYAQEILANDPAEQRRIETIHIAYYATFMNQHHQQWLSQEDQSSIDAMGIELSNIRIAWQRAVEHKEVKVLGQIVGPLYTLYEARGWFREGRDVFAWVLERLMPGSTSDEQCVWGQLLVHRAGFQIHLGMVLEAQRSAQQGVEALRRQEVAEPLAFATNILAGTYLKVGNYEAAGEALRESLSIRRGLGNRRGMLAPLANLGIVYTQLGDYVAAGEVLEEGLAICREQDVRHGLIRFLNNLAVLHYTMGDWATAQGYCEQALPVSEELERGHLKAVVLINLGKIHVRQTRFEQALADCQAAVDLMCQSNDLPNQVEGLTWLSLAHHGLGDQAAARRCLSDGLQIALKTQIPPSILCLLVGAGVLLLDERRREAGIDLLVTAARHPATEQSDRTYALDLLIEQGITLPDLVVYQEDCLLAEVANDLLVKLRTDFPGE